MKNLAIVGMVFLSMGLFAQAPKAQLPVKEKDKVCVKKCDKAKSCNKAHEGDKAQECCKSDKMKKAPIQKVDARKSSFRSGKARPVLLRKKGVSPKKVGHKRMIVPLSKKSAKVKEKM